MTAGAPDRGGWARPPREHAGHGPPDPAPGRWAVEHVRGPAAVFHGRALPEPAGRHLWLCEVDGPALVLGSAQRTEGRDGGELVDLAGAAAAGIDVVRRRSGGSAVLVEPGAVVWADVIIGRDDPLWDDDVGRATQWVGRWWQRAVAAVGIAAEVHTGPFDRGRWGDRICFAGLGPGELVVDGRKLVGVSQRRTRSAARFQTAALLRWEPGPLAALCHVPVADPELASAAVGLTDLTGRDAAALRPALVAAVIEQLPV